VSKELDNLSAFEAFWAQKYGKILSPDGTDDAANSTCRIARIAASDAWQAALAYKVDTTLPTDGFVDVVFDAPPGPTSGRFIEVENDKGFSINLGEWVHRPDGYWALRIHSDPAPRSNDLVPGEPATPKAMSVLADTGKIASEQAAPVPGGSAHTPAPWSFEFEGDGGDYFIKSEATGEMIVSDSLSRDFKLDGPEHEQLKATVRLMAAAPELLEALRRCRFDSLNMSLDDLRFCQAAYAKATGSAQ